MDLNLLIRYRTQLMGIAILWVMLIHSTLTEFPIPFLAQLKYMGYFGVDIFFFLSGIGIYFSFSKNSSIKEFFKRRFVRIIPYYIPIVLLFSIFLYVIGIYSLSDIVLNFFMLGYWFNINPFDWYIPVLCFFYLLSPFFIINLNRNRNVTLLVALLVMCGLWLFATTPKFSYLNLGMMRIPIYIVGILFGYFYSNNKSYKLSKIATFSIIVMFVISFPIWKHLFVKYLDTEIWFRYGLAFFFSLIMTVPVCLCFTYFLSFLKNYKYPILTFFGTYSLPIYITQVKIIDILSFYDVQNITIISTVLTIVFAVVWQKLVDRIIKKYFH